MFSLSKYPIRGKAGLPLCELHDRQLEMKEVVMYDREATGIEPPDHLLGVRSKLLPELNWKQLWTKIFILR